MGYLEWYYMRNKVNITAARAAWLVLNCETHV